MNKKKFISFDNGKATFGLNPSAEWVIDLEGMKQGSRTRPSTSTSEPGFGLNWIPIYGIEVSNRHFICDDDDGYLWLCEDTNIDAGEHIATQESLIDSDSYVEVCINLDDMTFYDKGNGCFTPIN